MDKAKSLAKGGWHPKGKDGGRESWRGDNKGINQVVSQHKGRISAATALTLLCTGWMGWKRQRPK